MLVRALVPVLAATLAAGCAVDSADSRVGSDYAAQVERVGVVSLLAPHPNVSYLGSSALESHFGQAVAAGWDVEGVEVNPKTAAHAERRTNALVHRSGIDAVAAGGRRYDAVTMTDVLEHIPDPVHVLTAAAGLLVPGGAVAVKVPSGPAQRRKEQLLSALDRGRPVSLADNLVHVNHFSPHSLRLALERAGFRDVIILPGAPELE